MGNKNHKKPKKPKRIKIKRNLVRKVFVNHRDWMLVGATLILLAVVIIASNPLNFADFPNKLTLGAIVGLVAYLVGIGGLLYGLKSRK